MGIQRTVTKWAALLVLVGGLLIWATPAAAGPVDDEQRFVQLINQTRAAQGLSPLIVDGELRSASRSWTASMAGADQLSHTGDLAKGISADWSVLGENVGVHTVGAVDQLFDAFLASPAHYQNVVDPRYTHIGVGVTHTEGGKLWTTHRFMKVEGAPAAAPPATVPPTTRPPTTNPPTTRPPTTAAPTTRRPTTNPPTTAPAAGPDGVESQAGGTVPAPIPTPDESTGTTTTAAEAGSDDPTTPDGDLVDLVKPDAETIEDVLIDLVASGI